ncbi:MAG: tryptophan 2,3-dioxygenase [Alphaproteobacteria bacterium]|nr:tryptophan 2,3-dioxygenase [Alphaproteobacteria bacterium]
MTERDGGGLEPGIHTDFAGGMSYGDYLRLDLLLAAQQPRSGCHDELLFITIHQASELWLKLMLHEVRGAQACLRRGDFKPALKMLSRVGRIQAQMIQSWDVLSTLTPSDYLAFRGALGRSSGFQSYGYRALEFALGLRDPAFLAPHRHDAAIHEALQAILREPGLYDDAVRLLARHGLAIPKAVLERDPAGPWRAHPAVRAAWLAVYRDTARHWPLYELAEKLVDIEDWFQQWRFRHMQTVERIIGAKRGTGGSSGVAYLRGALERRLFPELWELRGEL